MQWRRVWPLDFEQLWRDSSSGHCSELADHGVGQDTGVSVKPTIDASPLYISTRVTCLALGRGVYPCNE